MKTQITLLTILLFFGLSSCTFVRVTNLSDVTARVLVRVPDSGRGSTRNIHTEGAMEVFSANGGRYSVRLLPQERYKEFLESMRKEISRRLFEERQALSADDVARLIKNLNQIDKHLG